MNFFEGFVVLCGCVFPAWLTSRWACSSSVLQSTSDQRASGSGNEHHGCQGHVWLLAKAQTEQAPDQATRVVATRGSLTRPKARSKELASFLGIFVHAENPRTYNVKEQSGT